MLHYEQVFCNAFERGGVNVAQYWWNTFAKLKVYKWSLSKCISNEKPKNINLVPGQLLFQQCKAKFLLETDSLYWWSRWISISPVSLHALMKTLKRNISEAYKVQVDCLKDSEPDFYVKNDMKEKVNDLVRLHESMQEKLKTASYSE